MDRALHHFRSKRHEVIVFHVLDRAELEFPFGETASFVDMETGERIQVDPAYVRDDYRRQLEQFLGRLPPDLRRVPVRLCADGHLGPYRSHAFALPGETDPAMTFAAPLFLLADARRADPGGAAPDPPAEGQGGAVQHAAVPPDQRAADSPAEVHGGPVALDCAGGRPAPDRRRSRSPRALQPGCALGRRTRPRRLRSYWTTRPAWRYSPVGNPGSRPPGKGSSKVFARLRQGDQVALLTTGGPPGPELGRLFRTHETVRQALDQCRPSYERADLAAKIQQATRPAGRGRGPQQGDLRLHRQPGPFLGGPQGAGAGG